jgi:hypothetical protein
MLGTTLGVFFFSGVFLLVPSSVLAQESGSAATAPLASEYQRLRTDLDRLNAEVAALKRRGRSVRTDYILRDKMAEAEALARKVTAAEARLRAVRGPLPAEAPAGMVQTPHATPQDGALELEAKADLLSDQARRFRSEAEALARTAEQIRARQALRRRAGAWDRDPLAGFEASKRVAIITAQSSHAAASGDSSVGPTAVRGPGTPSSDTVSKSGGSGTASVPTTSTPVESIVSPGPSGSLSASASVVPGGSTPGAVPTTSAATPSASHPLTASAPLSTDSASKSAVQQRTLLDPATLAGIRNSLSQAGSLSDPDAVDAAATALRNHAKALDEHARRLRAQATQ